MFLHRSLLTFVTFCVTIVIVVIVTLNAENKDGNVILVNPLLWQLPCNVLYINLDFLYILEYLILLGSCIDCKRQLSLK